MPLNEKHCIPCEGGVSPLTDIAEDNLLKNIPGWEIDRKAIHTIRRTIQLPTFTAAMAFANAVASLAEEENHHPCIIINYKKVTIEFHTHAVLGLSENDFIMASKINAMNAK